MKKLYIIIILILIIPSCGKKNDPVYNELNSKLSKNKLKIV